MNVYFTEKSAPAIADVRALGSGDEIWLWSGIENRKDILRYAEAVGIAVLRGAHVRQMSR